MSDNRSEFAGVFTCYAKEQGWRHCFTYPKFPRMNAYVEHFNRTLQEEYVEYGEELLLEDIRGFNAGMLSYLGRYNGERPHWRLGCLTPCQALAGKIPDLSSMWCIKLTLYLTE